MSAGLASVDTLSIKTRTLNWKARSQKIEITWQRSSRLEQPLTKAPSTASESINKITSAPLIWSAKVSNARTAAIISTGTIWVVRWSQHLFTDSGMTAVNWTGVLRLRSKMTAPTRSGNFSLDLGSGVNPSVKMTESAGFEQIKSIGRGGPEVTRANSFLMGNLRYCLSEITRGPSRAEMPQTSPNISFPLSLPADPGSSRPDCKMESISLAISSLRLISSWSFSRL